MNTVCTGATVMTLDIGTPMSVSGDNTGALVNPFLGAPVVWEAFTTSACADVTVAYCGTSPAFAGSLNTLGVGCPLTNLVFNSNANFQTGTCGDGDVNFAILFPALPAGTYYFPVLEGTGSSGPYTLTFSAVACSGTAPANALCSAAVELVPSENCTPVAGTVEGATNAGNTGVGCEGGDYADGVWYSFEATTETHTITVDPSAQFSVIFEVFSGSCTTPISVACGEGPDFNVTTTRNVTGLTIGETYYVRVADWYAGSPLTSDFTICVQEVGQGVCNADAGTLTAGASPVCIVNGTATVSATANGDAVQPGGFQRLCLLAQSADGVIVNAAVNTPSFNNVTVAGLYTIHTLVYDAALDINQFTFGESTIADINALLIQGGGTICASLDMTGVSVLVETCVTPCAANAGTLTATNSTICFTNGAVVIGATANGDAVVPGGYQNIYLLASGVDQVIVRASVAPTSFSVSSIGLYSVHRLVFSPATLDLDQFIFGTSTIADINALLTQGGGSICAGLDLVGASVVVVDCQIPCDANAGTLTADEATVCFVDGTATISATPNGDAVEPPDYTTMYMLARGTDQVIVQISFDAASFTVTSTDRYTIHALVFQLSTLDLDQFTFGVSRIADVNALLVNGGGTICGSMDVVGASINVRICPPPCDARAGTLTAVDDVVCFEDGVATIGATPNGDAVVLSGFGTVYLLSRGNDLLFVDGEFTTPSFVVEATGSYRIHTLVYDPGTLDLDVVEFGVTTAAELNALLVQGDGTICASLDMVGTPIAVQYCVPPCDADAGTLTAIATEVCFEDNTATIGATSNGDVVAPLGSDTLYLLASGNDLVIQAGAATPSFVVGATGNYSIHTLIYDPATLDLGGLTFGVSTANDVHVLLIQGGGPICGSLDMVGASIAVQLCLPPCLAAAGTITAVDGAVCFENGTATIGATANGDAIIPNGFETLYLLTSGIGLVIENSAATPSFTVEAEGQYGIYALVYDPATLDPADLVLGTTTAGDVDALLIQGGGIICGSLDLAGTEVLVESCVPVCDAQAGTLTADAGTGCFTDGTATISATVNGDAIVPPDFVTVYVLTSGAGLVIQATGSVPAFDVTSQGLYTIHTLVYDPATLDLGSIVLGETTGGDVNSLLVQGSGTICGSLDVTGAPFTVAPCCAAQPGTITAENASICFVSGGVSISAVHNEDAVIPDGFELVFVLTSGPELVIQDTDEISLFDVQAPGLYTIHTLVYDPATLDLASIIPGETTGADINALLVQGGGAICGALDVTGAPTEVLDCSPVNNDCVNAIELPINAEGNCPDGAIIGDNTYATEEEGNVPGCGITAAYFADVWYSFNSGANTEVTIALDNGTMEYWAVAVSDACTGGTESICEIAPTAPIVLTTTANTTYWIRVYSNLEFGAGGEFGLCLSGASPTYVCDGGEVTSTDGGTSISICQDDQEDVIDFSTTTTSVENYSFLATDEDNTIVALIAGNSLDFNALPMGNYRVWGISHNGTLQGAEPGGLATEVTTDGDCLELSSNFVLVSVEICSGIATGSATTWSLFPNPSTGDFNVRYSGTTGKADIAVIDMDGRLVMQEQIAVAQGQVIALNGAGRLAQGIYTVRLSVAGEVTNLRITVQ